MRVYEPMVHNHTYRFVPVCVRTYSDIVFTQLIWRPFLPSRFPLQLAVTSVDLDMDDDHDTVWKSHILTLYNTSTNDDNTLELVERIEEWVDKSELQAASAVTFSRDDEHIYVYYPETTVRFDENHTVRSV